MDWIVIAACVTAVAAFLGCGLWTFTRAKDKVTTLLASRPKLAPTEFGPYYFAGSPRRGAEVLVPVDVRPARETVTSVDQGLDRHSDCVAGVQDHRPGVAGPTAQCRTTDQRDLL